MPQQTINIGAAPDDGTGDTIRVGGDKINDNFTELYADKLDKSGGTLTGDLVVPDEAYDATAWNGSLEVPTKNAVRDKIESLGASGLEIEDEGASEATGVIKLNFVGAGVAAVDQGGGEVEVTIPGGISTFALGDATDVDTTGQAAGEKLVYDGANWVPVGYRGALVKKAADQTTANFSTDAAVPWTAEEYDTDSIHDNSTNNSRLSVPSGVTKVKIGFNLYLSSVTAGSTVRAYLKKTGSEAFIGWVGTGLTTNALVTNLTGSSGAIPVTGGTDYFEVFLVCSDNSITILASVSNFWMEIVE